MPGTDFVYIYFINFSNKCWKEMTFNSEDVLSSYVY